MDEGRTAKRGSEISVREQQDERDCMHTSLDTRYEGGAGLFKATIQSTLHHNHVQEMQAPAPEGSVSPEISKIMKV